MTAHGPLAHPHRRAAVLFVFVTVAIDMLAFGIIIPVLPHLIVDLIGGSIAKAAVWSSGFGTVFMLAQFVCSPIQGALSDRFGRRTVILISSFGLGADFIVMALAPVLWLLFLGRAISGMCAASFSTANAYISDITPREKRAAAFGMLGGAFALGFIVGPALGGFLGHLWIRLPFWVAAGLSLINFCYGFCAAGIPSARAPQHANRLAAGQSARLADVAAALSAGVRAGDSAVPAGIGAIRAQFDVRAVYRLSLRLGAADRRLQSGRGGSLHRGRAGVAGQALDALAGRASHDADRRGAADCRLRGIRLCAERVDVPGWDSIPVPGEGWPDRPCNP